MLPIPAIDTSWEALEKKNYKGMNSLLEYLYEVHQFVILVYIVMDFCVDLFKEWDKKKKSGKKATKVHLFVNCK